MKVVARSADGKWDLWRVGRRRIAVLKTPGWMNALAGAGEIGLVGFAIALPTIAIGLTATLVVTAVVWPWREITGNWPVVAYAMTGGPSGGPDEWCVTVKGKANADLLARQWASEIKNTGAPVTNVG